MHALLVSALLWLVWVSSMLLRAFKRMGMWRVADGLRWCRDQRRAKKSMVLDARIVGMDGLSMGMGMDMAVPSIDVTDHLKAHLGAEDLHTVLTNQYILLALGSRKRLSTAASMLVLRVITMDLVELHFSGGDEICVQ